MKFCKDCGAPMNDDSRFCTRCGADNMTAAESDSQTTVNAEPSAQPRTDYQPNANSDNVYYQPNANNDNVYYQPKNDFSNGAPNAYPYQQPPIYQQPAPKKKKFPVWAIIIIVLVVLFVLGGLFAVGGAYILTGRIIGSGEESETVYEIYSGYETYTEYINSSVNLRIDSSMGDLEIMSDEYREYYDTSEGEFETFICDPITGDYIYVEILEGSYYESTQSMEDFVRETMEYWYGDDEDITIGDVYEREIAGVTYTCADVSKFVVNYDSEYYAWDTTTCFVRSGSTFFEIEITVYPYDSYETIDSMINTYFYEY